jgi:predicted phage-related endonuclease
MLHHWENDSIPDYYAMQCHQNMAVMGWDRWDLVALLGGTDLRIVTIERDPEIESAILETIEEFWAQFIETNTPPPPTDLEERRRYLRIRYPGSEATKCVELDSAEVREAIADYQQAHEHEKEAKQIAEATTLRLIELVGNEYGIEGAWGKFIAPSVAGRVNWQRVAEQLAGGTIPADVIEQHRGEKYRLGRFYPPTTKTTKKKGRRS